MSIGYYIQVIVTLALLSAVLYGVIRGAKYIQKRTYAGEMKIVDRLGIDANVALLIVEVRAQQYLISIGGKDIKILEKL